MAKETKSLSLLGPTNTVFLRTKSLRLMGSTIMVTETKEGEFESERMFIEKNKHLFKYRGGRNSNTRIRRRIFDTQSSPTLEIPANVRTAIEAVRGTDLVFMMSKKLKDSDAKKYQNRLYVRKSRRLMDYLTEEEKQKIEVQGKDGGLDVTGIDPRGKTYNLNLKLWQSCGSSNKYVLIKEWAKLISDNGLGKDDLVEVWCFRVDSNLQMAVIAKKKIGSDLGVSTSGSSNADRRADLNFRNRTCCSINPNRMTDSDLGVSTSGVEINSDLGVGTSGIKTDSDLGVDGTSGSSNADRRADLDFRNSTSCSINPNRMTDSDLGVGTSGAEINSNLGVGTNGIKTDSDLGVDGTSDL